MRRSVLAVVGFVIGSVVPSCKGAAPPGETGGAPSASGRAPEPRTVAFRILPARVGDRVRTVRKTSVKMGVELWQGGAKVGSNDSGRTEAYARTEEVLGLVGGAPARVRVRYDRYHLDEKAWDKPARADGSLEGRTFVLDATEGKVTVTAEGSAPPGEAEQGLLAALHPDLGKDDPLLAGLGSRPIPVGKTVPLRETLFRVLSGWAASELKEGTIVLRETVERAGRAAAIFEWKAAAHSSEENGLEVDWSFHGTATVATAPAGLVESSVEATLDLEGRTRQGPRSMDLQGAGSLQDDRAVTTP